MKLLIVLLIATAALAQLPPAPGARIVSITPQPGFLNEPSIAINPANPQQLVAGYQTNASIVYSQDGGMHWLPAAGVAPKDYRVSGDPSVTYDARGQAIICYIAFDRLGTASYWGHNATRNGIFIRRSPDGGATWEPAAVAVAAHPTEPGIPFEDKPYIVADNSRSRHRGNLYVGWTQFTLTRSMILLSRSTDGGASWSAPIKISSHDGLPRDDNGSVEGFTGAVADDGTLYTVWSDAATIAFTSSRDGGRTFARSRDIVKIAPPYFQVADVSRANGFPQIGWTACHGERGCMRRYGMLYVTWSDYRNGDVDVFCITSRNGGRTWSAPVRVNSDNLHNGADQFFQWLAVDPASGAANVIFYDRRSDPQDQKTTVVLARSGDGGRNFVNYAWTQQAFRAREDFLGDYTGIAALNGRVYGIWAEEVQPAPAPPAGNSPAAQKEAPAQGEKEPDQTLRAAPKHRTAVYIGVADFTTTSKFFPPQSGSSQPATVARNSRLHSRRK